MTPERHGDATEQASTAVPSITKADLHQFWVAHFSPANVAQFSRTFLNPASHADEAQEEEFVVQDEDGDDLGYYDDGVKRTLTDEQIAIFRHSEVESMRRAQEKATGKGATEHSDITDAPPAPTSQIQSSLSLAPSHSKERQSSKKKMRKRQEPKPDLRKRTWDVVDRGLDTLEYD